MSNNEIEFLGKIIEFENCKYRVIYIENDISVLCELNTTKLELIYHSEILLLGYIQGK